MGNSSTLLVVFGGRDELDAGYAASMLLRHGFRPTMIPGNTGTDEILARINDSRPLSVTFFAGSRTDAHQAAVLATRLRQHGVACHLAAGGRYASLQFRELIAAAPGLDSVVLFEPERTCTELARCLEAGRDWRGIDGLAYRANGGAVANPLRPLEPDLDSLPPPLRGPLRARAMGKREAALLAGRSCFDLSPGLPAFGTPGLPPGPVWRVRRPEMVTREMELLHYQRDCSVFLFADSAFPVGARNGRRWTSEFCRLLIERRLANGILWGINCRCDEVERELFETMRGAGLFQVRLGIASDQDNGAALFTPHTDPDRAIRAVEALNHLRIAWDIGFVLGNGSGNWQTISDKLNFLEAICNGGASPVAISVSQSAADAPTCTGHNGSAGNSAASGFPAAVAECFGEWVEGPDGLVSAARLARYTLALCRKYFPDEPGIAEWEAAIADLTAAANIFLLNRLRRLAMAFEGRRNTVRLVQDLKAEATARHSHLCAELRAAIAEIEHATASAPLWRALALD